MNQLPLIDINYYQATKQLSPYPLNVMLETSAICNIKCPMCPRAYSERKKRKDGLLSYENFQKIMAQLKPSIITLHYSGEPTLNSDLPNMAYAVKYMHEIPFMKMNTNGTMFSNEENRKRLLEGGWDLITFSLECCEEIQKKYRKGADYNIVKENIIKTKEMQLKIIPQTDIIIQHLKGNNITDEMLQESAEFWSEKKIPVKIASICTIGEQVEDFGSVRNAKKNCREIWTNMIISYDGKVTPCCVDHSFQLSFGNILETPIEKLWVNEKITELRYLHTHFNKYGEKKRLPKLCQQCLGSK